jgi:hypothetical protein
VGCGRYSHRHAADARGAARQLGRGAGAHHLCQRGDGLYGSRACSSAAAASWCRQYPSAASQSSPTGPGPVRDHRGPWRLCRFNAILPDEDFGGSNVSARRYPGGHCGQVRRYGPARN